MVKSNYTIHSMLSQHYFPPAPDAAGFLDVPHAGSLCMFLCIRLNKLFHLTDTMSGKPFAAASIYYYFCKRRNYIYYESNGNRKKN